MTSKSIYFAFLHLVVVALAVQVVVLGKQNREMKQRQNPIQTERLKAGDTLAFSGLQSVRPGYVPDTLPLKRVVFVLSTKCPFCSESLPLWNRLTSRLSGHVNVFAVSLDSKDSTISFVNRNDITFPVLVPLNLEGFKKTNRTHAVPLTLLTSSSGIIEQIWVGGFDEKKLREVSSAALSLK